MNATAMQQEALAHATQSESMANYAAIFTGFAEKGIEAAHIQPRVNVFTFNAWKALGRSVRKGEHGLMIWCPTGRKGEDSTEPAEVHFIPGTVFDVSQTDVVELEQAA